MHNNKFPPEKIPERKSDSEAGCIFENFTPKQGNSLKILAAGTRNHGVSLPPGGVVYFHFIRMIYQHRFVFLTLPFVFLNFPFVFLNLPFLFLNFPFVFLNFPFVFLNLPSVFLNFRVNLPSVFLNFPFVNLPFVVLNFPFVFLNFPFVFLNFPFVFLNLPFLFLNFPFECQNISSRLKLNKPRLFIVCQVFQKKLKKVRTFDIKNLCPENRSISKVGVIC